MVKTFLITLIMALPPSSVVGQGWEFQNPLPLGDSMNDIRIIGENSIIAVFGPPSVVC
jgi:hypothetical protein